MAIETMDGTLDDKSAAPETALEGAAVPEWRTARIPLPSGRSAVVRIEPRGTLPVLVRRLVGEPPGKPAGH